MLGFSCSSIVTAARYAYPNLLNKGINLFQCKYQIIFITLLVFVDVSEKSIMEDDVTMPLNPPVVLVKGKELEKAPLDVNVSNNCMKKNHLKEWCTPKSIVEHGIINCLLTHMP
jgi:hypothetical protein